MALQVFFGVGGDQDIFTRTDNHITTALQGAAVQQHVAAVLHGDAAVVFIQRGVHGDVATGNHRTANIFRVQCFIEAGFATPKRFFLFLVFVVVFRIVHGDQIGIAFGMERRITLYGEGTADHVDILPGFQARITTGRECCLYVCDGAVDAVVALAMGFAVSGVGYRFQIDVAGCGEVDAASGSNCGTKEGQVSSCVHGHVTTGSEAAADVFDTAA